VHDERVELGSREAPRDPEELEAQAAETAAQLSPLTRLGPVHLSVADLERSLSYYRSAVGLEPVEIGNGTLSLGCGGRTLLVLVEEPGASSAYGYTGLYHFALLVPERVDLARWLAHAARDRVQLQGLSDHYVSEAIYLSDPDGHGIEVYWDRPREHWQGQVAERMTTLPLDVDGLLGELADPASERFEVLPAGTVIGHVHLKVADIPGAIAFYGDTLGFALMARLGGQAAFLAAGGYHHHLGANTWESAGAGAAPPGTASLRHATIVLASREERDGTAQRVREAGHPGEVTSDGPIVADPSGNHVLLTTV
jgi:catechol 2,3-dioxygenase